MQSTIDQISIYGYKQIIGNVYYITTTFSWPILLSQISLFWEAKDSINALSERVKLQFQDQMKMGCNAYWEV